MAQGLIAVIDAIALIAMCGVAGATPATWAYAIVALGVLAFTGSYRPRTSLRVAEEIPTLVPRLGTAVVLAAPLSLMAGDADILPLQAALSVVAVVASRCGSYTLIRDARRRGGLLEPTVIVGTGEVACELGRHLEDRPEHGLTPIGHVGEAGGRGPGARLGNLHDLSAVLRASRVRHVVVAFSRTPEHELIGVVRAALLHGVDVHVVPRFFEIGALTPQSQGDEVWGIPLCQLNVPAVRSPGWRVKRAFDVAISATALVLVAPVMAMAAIAVRLTSPGPVLFRQRRLGQFGREFDCLKFRTMLVNDDADTTWSVVDDDRVTSVGRLLRHTNVDELPQLWNILRGDMSLVGPRPERPFFAEQFATEIPGYGDRLRVPVGLTGWAQVHGLRGDTSIAERARFDNNYIERWSPWRDLAILFRTVGAVVWPSRAFAATKNVVDLTDSHDVEPLSEAGGASA